MFELFNFSSFQVPFRLSRLLGYGDQKDQRIGRTLLIFDVRRLYSSNSNLLGIMVRRTVCCCANSISHAELSISDEVIFRGTDVDVKIEACGVCGSDIHTITGTKVYRSEAVTGMAM